MDNAKYRHIATIRGVRQAHKSMTVNIPIKTEEFTGDIAIDVSEGNGTRAIIHLTREQARNIAIWMLAHLMEEKLEEIKVPETVH